MFTFRDRRDTDGPLEPSVACATCGGTIGRTELVWREAAGGAIGAGYLPAVSDGSRVWHLDCLQREGCHVSEHACARAPRRPAARSRPERVCASQHAPTLAVAPAPCHRPPAAALQRHGARPSPSCAARRAEPR